MTNSKETPNKKVLVAETKGEQDMAVNTTKTQKNTKKLNLKNQKAIIEMIQTISEGKHTNNSLIPELSSNWRTYFNEQFNMTLGVQKTNMLVDDVNAYLRNCPNEDLNEYLEDYGKDVINVVKKKIENELRNTVLRKRADLMQFCECIKTNEIYDSNRRYLSINFDLTEEEFDKNFGDSNNAPLLYVFLKSCFIRKMSITEIMEDIVVLNKRNTCKNPAKLQKAKKLAACDIIREILKTTHLIDANKENGVCQIGNIDFLNF